MAKSDTHKYTVQEKLNKMDVDVISVSVTVATNAANDLMYVPVEIPNAVSVPGGTCIIQSIVSHNPTDEDQSHNLFIISGATLDPTTGLPEVTTDGTTARAADAALGSLNIDASHLTDIQGIVPIPAGYAVGDDDMVASVSSIGMIAKAEAGSTSLYAFGISTTGDTISTTFNLKFCIVKD